MSGRQKFLDTARLQGKALEFCRLVVNEGAVIAANTLAAYLMENTAELAQAREDLTKATTVAGEFSDIIHSIKGRGIDLTRAEDRAWARATLKDQDLAHARRLREMPEPSPSNKEKDGGR